MFTNWLKVDIEAIDALDKKKYKVNKKKYPKSKKTTEAPVVVKSNPDLVTRENVGYGYRWLINGLMVLMLVMLSFTVEGQYKINKNKLIGWGVVSLSGFVDGAVHGFVANRKVFEERWGVEEDSFFGSMRWDRLNYAPNVWNKTQGVFDFYHVGDRIRKGGYIGGSIMIGIGGRSANGGKFKYYVFDFIIASVLSSGMKNLSYELLKR